MIPAATTTITVLRASVPDQYEEPYGGDQPTDRAVVATGVRAVIDRPTGREQVAGGEQNRVDLALACDPVDIEHRDLVRDDTSGHVYRVVWVLSYPSHVEGGLQIISGEV